MHKRTILCATLALSACASISPEGAERRDAIRATLMAQVGAWNAAGIDPVRLPAAQLTYAALACGSASGVATIWRPDAPEMSDELAAWCADLVRIAAPTDVPAAD